MPSLPLIVAGVTVAMAYDCDTTAAQQAAVLQAAVASLRGWVAQPGSLVFRPLSGVAENPTAVYATYEFDDAALPGDNTSWYRTASH